MRKGICGGGGAMNVPNTDSGTMWQEGGNMERQRGRGRDMRMFVRQMQPPRIKK